MTMVLTHHSVTVRWYPNPQIQSQNSSIQIKVCHRDIKQIAAQLEVESTTRTIQSQELCRGEFLFPPFNIRYVMAPCWYSLVHNILSFLNVYPNTRWEAGAKILLEGISIAREAGQMGFSHVTMEVDVIEFFQQAYDEAQIIARAVAESMEEQRSFGGAAPFGSVIKRLGNVTWEGTEEEKCAVCLDLFLVGMQLKRTTCSHLFHGECLIPWLRQSRTCPVCRLSL